MKKTAVSEAQATTITIPAIDIRTVVIKIVGDSPLIARKWSEKAKKRSSD